MARPSKPIALVEGHRTNAEKSSRAEVESSLVTGMPWREWPEVKQNPVAHKLYQKLNKLFKKIDKNDALSEPIINRYCILQAECAAYEEDDRRLRDRMEELDDRFNNEEDKSDLKYADYIKLALDIERQIAVNDTRLQAKRKMLLDIERETCMTLKAQLAAIPKKAKKPDENRFSKFGAKKLA